MRRVRGYPRCVCVMSSGQIPSVAPLGRSRILVVDDSATLRETLCATLRRAGFQTVHDLGGMSNW